MYLQSQLLVVAMGGILGAALLQRRCGPGLGAILGVVMGVAVAAALRWAVFSVRGW